MFTQRALFAIGAVVSLSVSSAEKCEDISLLFSGKPSVATPEKSFTFAYTLVNEGAYAVTDSAVAITLADGVTYTSAGKGPLFKSAVSSGVSYDAGTNAVAWGSAGAVPKAKGTTKFWVETVVNEDAELLTFEAEATLTLSNGETCVVTPLPSQVKVKGYKNTVASPFPPVVPPPQTVFPFSTIIDCNASGYEEEVVFSAEGIEIVSECHTGGNAPAEITAISWAGNTPGQVYCGLFARKAADPPPLAIPVGDWFGYCDGQGVAVVSKKNNNTLNYYICGGAEDGTTIGATRSDYPDLFVSLSNAYGGLIVQNAGLTGFQLININVGDKAVCYQSSTVTYKPSTFVE